MTLAMARLRQRQRYNIGDYCLIKQDKDSGEYYLIVAIRAEAERQIFKRFTIIKGGKES